MQLQKWLCGELTFHATATYADPFSEVEMTAVFTCEDGTVLTRPAFWDGGDVWRVRVALTRLGAWTYTTACSNKGDTGLHGVSGTIECVEYTGEHAIYKHGFLKVSEDGHYFVHDDGTPFFYLGDTHWLMPHEHWNDSNVEGIESQFRFMVDMRIAQGFTVYQSEPLSPPRMNFHDGIDEADVAVLREAFDVKFRYLAENGLVHANAQLFFTPTINDNRFTPEYLVRLTKMWSARYGAYPVLWTVAQESDADFYGGAEIRKWMVVAETLYLNDCYKHPLTAHMCNDGRCFAHNTAWGDKYFHSWFGLQAQGMSNLKYFRDFYNYKPTQPMVNYETGYEHLWNPENGAVCAGYRSFLNGVFGYGYGAHGVWNGNYDSNDWMDYGGYMRWFEGLNLPGGAKLIAMRQLFESIPWWKLTPRFDDTAWWDFDVDMCLSTLEDHTYIAMLFKSGPANAVFKQLKKETYSAFWFDVHTGNLTLAEEFVPENGTYTLPPKPDAGSWVIIVTSRPELFTDRPLMITSQNFKTVLTHRGDTLQLSANRPVRWSEDDADIAQNDENGLLRACGKNGNVRVTAEASDGSRVTRKFVVIRQYTQEPPKGPESVSVRPFIQWENRTKLMENDKRITFLPVFEPYDSWYQNAECVLTDKDGNPSYIMAQDNNYVAFPICDGTFYAKFVMENGVESEPVEITVTGYGEASLILGAPATCDDFHEKYDSRCLPSRATSGTTSHFTGWCSEKVCTKEDPAILTVLPPKPVKINQIVLYTTDLGYTLDSFDIVLVTADGEKIVGSVRGNKQTELTFDFEAVEASAIKVVCYKGDLNGNARVDQINAYLR